MFFQKPIRYRHELFIPTIVAGLVAADQEQRGAAWIKCEQNPIWPSCMLDDEFFHVGMAGSRYMPTCGRRSAGPNSSRRSTTAATLLRSSFERPSHHAPNSGVVST